MNDIQQEDEYIKQDNYFDSEIKRVVMDLIAKIPEIQNDITNNKNVPEQGERFEQFKYSFHTCFLLTQGRVNDSKLVSETQAWFKKEGQNDKHTRLNLSEDGIYLQSEWISEMDKQNIISFSGNKPISFPFLEIIENHSLDLNMTDLSPTYKYLIDTLLFDKIADKLVSVIGNVVWVEDEKGRCNINQLKTIIRDVLEDLNKGDV